MGRFDAVCGKITIAGLPSCWDPTTPSVLRPLTEYKTRLQEEKDQTDILLDKTTRLKAKKNVSSLCQDFTFLHLINHKLPTKASFNNLTEAYVRV